MPLPAWSGYLTRAKFQVTFEQQKHCAIASADGRFEVTLDSMPADELKSVNDAPPGRTLTAVTQLGGKEAKKLFPKS